MFCKVYLYLVLLPLWFVHTFLSHLILFLFFVFCALFVAPYLSTHSSIKIGQNQIFFGFSDPPSVSAVQKVCRPIPSKRNFVCVLSISFFALLTTLVTLIHRHLSHSKRNSETVILSQIQSKVKIPQFTLPKPLPPNSCVSCLSGMEQHSSTVWLVLLLLSFTKFTRLKIPRGQWVRRPAVCPNHNYHSASRVVAQPVFFTKVLDSLS